MTLKVWGGTETLTRAYTTTTPENFPGGVGLVREVLKRNYTSKKQRHSDEMVSVVRTGGLCTSGESQRRLIKGFQKREDMPPPVETKRRLRVCCRGTAQ